MKRQTKVSQLQDRFKDTFQTRYKNLNPEQKRTVDTIDGPVMVVAGPGTGKTEILALRIANILAKTDTAPDNILALTFTDSASVNMRKRLSTLIGASAYRVSIETFHSFCNNIIKNYPEYFPTIIGSGNITEVEGVSILEHLINTLPLSLLHPWGDPLYYVKDVYKKIEELKREGVSPEAFLKLITEEELRFKGRDDLYHEKGAYKGKMKNEHKETERKIEKNKELAMVYEAYQKTLHERRLYDWSDMIMEVLKQLTDNSRQSTGRKEENELKLFLQENHQYILVDEHQDTNNAQNRILELLCDFHQNPNIFIVGDEKQAIFRFQGASVENFMYFKKLYPKAVLIELSTNYRSGQNILDAAHSLIASHTPLQSPRKTQTQAGISVAEFINKKHELHFVAERVKTLIEKGVEPREIAIIYRSNKEAFAVADMLAKVGVGYGIESDEDLLSEKFVMRFIALADAIAHYGDDQYLTPALHLEEFSIDPLDTYRLIHDASKDKKSLYDMVIASDNQHIKQFGHTLKELVTHSRTEHLTQFLEKILRESGILNSMIASRDASAFLGIERLFEEGKRISENRPGATFADFMEYVDTLRTHKLFIKRPKHTVQSHAVRLMTAHRAKGLEFEYVFIIGATENSFGPKRVRDSLSLLPAIYSRERDKSIKSLKSVKSEMGENQAVADERRLFYVALTRAKHEVYITYSTIDENGKEMLPSPFILEIRADRKEVVDTKVFQEKIEKHPEVLFAEAHTTGATDIDRNFVAELFHSHPLSVTALNNYLDCPWKYFYRNLLRIPSAPARHQIYGIAMHSAVEDLWRVLKEREVTADFVVDAYKRHLGLLGVLTDKEFKEALDRGTQALTGWFAWTNPKLTNPVTPEFKIAGVELTEGVVLSGVLDKVEMLSQSKVIVTDYKTGKQRSRNFIEGKTKDATGDMKRQLQFYKLLLQLHDNIDMKSGIIEFLEPNESGNYSREEFEITDTEVDELKQTIVRVSNEITSLEFWNKTCDDKDCEYCAYRKLL